jgi:hypothetical protein
MNLPAPIEQLIYEVRGFKVMLDSDLAEIYGVETKRLNEQVKRNIDRFPEDFMFQLSKEEYDTLRSQIATSKRGKGGRRYLPYVFPEHGAVMLANVLNSPAAVQASIQVVRAFNRLRSFALTHEELAKKIHDLEKKHDRQFQVVFDALRQLLNPPDQHKRRIGFNVEDNPEGKSINDL